VLINLKEIKDQKFVDEMRKICSELRQKAQKKLDEVLLLVDNKL